MSRLIDPIALKQSLAVSAILEDGQHIFDIIDAQPTIEERKAGEWIVHFNDLFPAESTEECSICHAEQLINGNDDNYCPNCGARMEGER